jgi:hypothetical protein
MSHKSPKGSNLEKNQRRAKLDVLGRRSSEWEEPTDNLVALDEWNIRFQSCLEQLHALDDSCGASQKMITNIEIMHLSEDFVHASRTVGKIIISEVRVFSFSHFL